LVKDSKKMRMYCEAVSQYIEDGPAQLTDKGDHKADKIRYLPHHGVFREDRATTKCRVRFDSNAKMYDGHSLNSCLQKLPGPKLQPDPGHVLIIFRCHRIGMMADIKEMFLQIKLKHQTSEQSQIPVERWTDSLSTRSLLHDLSDIRRYPVSFPLHCYSTKACKRT